MGKALGGPGEAGGQADDRPTIHCGRLPLQGRAQDGLDARDVEQLEAEGPRTGGIDARGAIAMGEPQQFLSLPQARPGEHAAEEHADELLDRRPDLRRLARTGGRIPQGVGRQCQWSSNNPHLWSLKIPHPPPEEDLPWTRNC